MQKVILRKVTSCLVACLTSLWASSVVMADEGIRQFKEFIATVNNAQGEFSQQQIRPSKTGEGAPKVLRKSQGRFVFQKPGQFVWETTKPFEQKIIADGQRLLLWDKDLNQLTIRAADKGLSASPAAILFGQVAVEEHFDLISGGQKGGMFWVELQSKNKNNRQLPYSRMGIGMSNGLPAGLELHDNFGTIVLINLSKIQINQSLGANVFQFTPPPGADVLNAQ